MAIYALSGYALLAVVRRRLPSPWAAFAIGVGGVAGVAIVLVTLIPFAGPSLDSSGAVAGVLSALGVGAVLGSLIGLWSIGRKA